MMMIKKRPNRQLKRKILDQKGRNAVCNLYFHLRDILPAALLKNLWSQSIQKNENSSANIKGQQKVETCVLFQTSGVFRCANRIKLHLRNARG